MESFLALNNAPEPRGFTLIEMVVVLAIIVIITGVVLTGQNNFDHTLSITDTAYAVALSIREAQTFGLSSRTDTGQTSADYAYGVHFVSATPGTYQFFADIYPTAPGTSSAYCPGHTEPAGSTDAKAGNCIYDASQNELVQNYTFDRGFTITNICGHDPSQGGTQVCTSTGYLTGADIVFLRPNTDSVVTGLRTAGDKTLSDLQITVSAPQGGTSLICVTAVGEVSVATSSCP